MHLDGILLESCFIELTNREYKHVEKFIIHYFISPNDITSSAKGM